MLGRGDQTFCNHWCHDYPTTGACIKLSSLSNLFQCQIKHSMEANYKTTNFVMLQGPLSDSNPSFGNKSHPPQPSTPLQSMKLRETIFPPIEPAHPLLPLRVDMMILTVTAPSCRKRSVLSNCWPGVFLIIKLRAAGFASGLR